MGRTITDDAMLRALTHTQGGLKKMPEQARRVVLLNQAGTPELQAAANSMVKPLLADYDAVIIAPAGEKDLCRT